MPACMYFMHLHALLTVISLTCICQSLSSSIFAVQVALPSDISSIAAQSGCSVTERMDLPGNIYIMKCTSSSSTVNKKLSSRPSQVLQHEEQLPLRIEKKQMHFSDPHYNKQWFLNNERKAGCDMQVQGVWKQGITGKGIVVAVVDDGVNFKHVDLKASENKGASFFSALYDTGSNFPLPGDKHGTNCAGLIASRPNNSNCGVGIAYGSTLGSIRLLTKTVLSVDVARALLHKNQLIHIYSNSWGIEDSADGLDGPRFPVPDAIEDGINNGRSGLGSIYLFAVGNGFLERDNCGFDGYVNSPYVIGISGLSETCNYPYYSEGCSAVFATAFTQGSSRKDSAGILTTSAQDDSSCREDFNGTSASTSMASGAVALMLEANSDLTWRDVQHITALTSRQDLCPEMPDEPTVTNGRGLRVSYYCGFGAMSSERMVTMAKMWTKVPKLVNCRLLYEPKRKMRSGTIKMTFLKSNACLKKIKYLESVQVKVKADLNRRGGLNVLLTSPQNTTSTIIKGRKSDNHSGDSQLHKWPQKSIFYWGEDSHGNWKLVFKCEKHWKEFGYLRAAELILYGTAEEPIRLKRPHVVPEWLKKFEQYFYDPPTTTTRTTSKASSTSSYINTNRSRVKSLKNSTILEESTTTFNRPITNVKEPTTTESSDSPPSTTSEASNAHSTAAASLLCYFCIEIIFLCHLSF